MTQKTCRKCLDSQELSNFYKQKWCELGVQNYCKTCVKEIRKQNYLMDPAPIKARAAKWNKEHKDILKVKYRPQKLKQMKQWADKNREHKRAVDRANYHRNPDRYKLAALNRKLKKTGATWPVGWKCTIEWWNNLKMQYNNSCAYCFIDCSLTKLGKPTMEHVIPLSRGGLHAAHNIVPACSNCNDSKHDKTPF